jgi:hypothetical protein
MLNQYRQTRFTPAHIARIISNKEAIQIKTLTAFNSQTQPSLANTLMEVKNLIQQGDNTGHNPTSLHQSPQYQFAVGKENLEHKVDSPGKTQLNSQSHSELMGIHNFNWKHDTGHHCNCNIQTDQIPTCSNGKERFKYGDNTDHNPARLHQSPQYKFAV